jgi:membrane protease YdiL (CAAX protease family)
MTEYLVVNKKINLRKLQNITFLLLYSLFAFYFLVNGPGVFDEWSTSWTMTTIVYLVGVALFLGLQENLPRELEAPVDKSILGFSLAFLLATLVFIILYDLGWLFQNVTGMPLSKIPAHLVYQLVIVVASEEIIFRGVIFRFFFKYFGLIIAMIVSSVFFSLFHFAAYSGNIISLGFAFLMGLVLSYMVYRFNIGVAIGLHYAWNAYVLGITALV